MCFAKKLIVLNYTDYAYFFIKIAKLHEICTTWHTTSQINYYNLKDDTVRLWETDESFYQHNTNQAVHRECNAKICYSNKGTKYSVSIPANR